MVLASSGCSARSGIPKSAKDALLFRAGIVEPILDELPHPKYSKRSVPPLDEIESILYSAPAYSAEEFPGVLGFSGKSDSVIYGKEDAPIHFKVQYFQSGAIVVDPLANLGQGGYAEPSGDGDWHVHLEGPAAESDPVVSVSDFNEWGGTPRMGTLYFIAPQRDDTLLKIFSDSSRIVIRKSK